MKKNQFKLAMLAVCMSGTGMSMAADPNDGELDPTWDGDGVTYVAFDLGGAGNNYDAGHSAVATPGGSLFIAGLVLDADNNRRIGVAKRAPDGGPDTDFSGDGRNLAPITGIEFSRPIKAALTEQGDADILLVAATRRASPTDTDIVVCRFNANAGNFLNFPAPNAPVDGCTVANGPLGQQELAEILVQPDGKFIVVGTHAGSVAPNEKYAYAVRFNADGSIDESFEHAPLRTSALFDSHEVKAAALASNGKIVIVGATKRVNLPQSFGLIMRLNPDGTKDGNEVGGSLLPIPGRDTVFNDVVLEKNSDSAEDAIIPVGSLEYQEDAYGAVIAKFTDALDDLDETFGEEGGWSIIANPLLGDLAYSAVAAHPCTGFVAVTSAAVGGDALDMWAFRWTRAGAPIGSTIIDIIPGHDQIDFARDVTVAGDGVYVAGFSVSSIGDTDFGAAKLFMDSIFCDGFQR